MLEQLALKRGPEGASAREELVGPELPEDFTYLLDYDARIALWNRPTADGASVLTPTTLRDWAILEGIDLDPLESNALFRIAATRRAPPPLEPDED